MKGEAAIMRKWASVGRPDEALLQRLDIDTRMVVPRHDPDWNEYWMLSSFPDGVTYRDEWGVLWTGPETGPAFIAKHPLAGEITLADLEKYPWPDPDVPERYAGLREQAEQLKTNTDYAVVAMFPRPIVSLSQFLRGHEDWFVDLSINHELIVALMDRILEVDLRIGRKLLDLIGKYVDIVFFHDDLATQAELMCSPEIYRKIIKPRHRQIVDFIKSHSHARGVYHCDGAILPIIGDFIQIGVDALNPVQISAKGRDSKSLKSQFGDRPAFWGAIDTHTVPPKGTVEEVRQEVKAQIGALGMNGGYVLAAVHNIQDDVPPQNIVAMVEEAREFGRYG